ncbi:MAG: hypothetical protein JWO97_2738 [Acidobacteria bacterium]|nr:hypothetical protein [Acidobacteriota bacterium]
MTTSQRARRFLELGAILILWAAAIVVIRPRGDFPLNDDWDFAIATWNFARFGEFRFTHFTAMSLRALVLWGAAWTRLFGESFEVLRAATLTLAVCTIVLVHRILTRLRVPASLRIVATLTFAFHPIFIWASCTYMTEVPFVFVSMLAFWFFWRGLEEDRQALLVAGCAAVVVSWFIRQTGVATLLAPLAILLLMRERLTPRWKRFAAIVCATMLFFVALLIFKREWLAGAPEEFANHFRMWTEQTFRLPEQIAVVYHYSVFNVQNAALFFLPLVAPLLFLLPRYRDRVKVALFAVVALLLFARAQSLINIGHPMPYFSNPYCCDILAGNTLVDWGLGMQTLTDVWAKGKPYPFQLSSAGRFALTYGSVVAAILLAGCVIIEVIRRRELFPMLATALALAGTAALFGSGLYVDRYSFDAAWSIGFALVAIVPWERRGARIVAIIALICVASFDVLSVNEYFAWNRARWAAIGDLRARGIPIEQIDGGSEPFTLYEVSKMTQRERRRSLGKSRPYMLAFNADVPGYAPIARYEFEGWLGTHRGAVWVLEQRGVPQRLQ